MYQQQGLLDYLYMMTYGAAGIIAVLACAYLLLRRQNIFSDTINPPLALRRWAAAFLAAVAMSHVWWIVVGQTVLTDDRFLRNAVNILLDSVTLVPLMMCTLLIMLQDRRHTLWPVGAAIIPVVAAVVGLGFIRRDPAHETIVRNYLFAVSFTFIIYMAYRIRQYSRWLKQNYADLEHKEVWQSLAFMFVILMMFVCYKTNFGGFATEYAIQVMTLVLTGFLVWRVETLQQLGEPKLAAVGKPAAAVAKRPAARKAAPNTEPISAMSYIPAKMESVCKEKQIYLQQGLTLMQLSTAVGVNRTYLSKWFAQQGTTFNAYINKLRVEYFMNRYIELMAEEKTFSAQELALKSGFQSYRTFYNAFLQVTGQSFSSWMKKYQ